MDEDNKPNLHNTRFVLEKVLEYEVRKCPIDVSSVDDCFPNLKQTLAKSSRKVKRQKCWDMLWLYPGINLAGEKVKSSLEHCPSAAIGYYPSKYGTFRVFEELFLKLCFLETIQICRRLLLEEKLSPNSGT